MSGHGEAATTTAFSSIPVIRGGKDNVLPKILATAAALAALAVMGFGWIAGMIPTALAMLILILALGALLLIFVP